MELLYVIYTYNRPTVLRECLRSLFANNDLRPERVVIIDDGSEPDLKESLSQRVAATESIIDLISFKKNIGYGRVAEIGFAIASMFDPKYCFFIESDYIFRKHGLDEVMDVFRSDLGRFLAGIAGYSHPDFLNPDATCGRYLTEIKQMYGEDNLNRDILYKPFPFDTRFGQVNLQFVSNSCGTMYLNWRLVSEMRREFYPQMERQWLEPTYNKGRTPSLLNDGVMSQGLSHFWAMYAKKHGWETNKYAALVDIIPSVANHLCGGGITGKVPGIQEGQTFVGSASFPGHYDEYRPEPVAAGTSR